MEKEDYNLHITLFVADVSVNLLSVGKITDSGNKVVFEKDRAYIIAESGEVTLTALKKDGLYYLEIDEKETANYTPKENNNIMEWHRSEKDGDRQPYAPQPPIPWTNIFEATEHGPVCPQFDNLTQQIIKGNEDCLYLNVYTKSLQTNSRTPVMVYIHGGGFMNGSGNSDMYGPDFLLQHNVVLVTINYRLEVFGFLCLDTPEVPGNAGMKDQVAALRWVQNNIAQFDGDPHNVTIFGESAGSASVTHHLLSPMSKGLFHKAIAQSGVSLCDWAIENDAKDIAFRIGKQLGNDTTNTDELLKFLLTVPADTLINITPKIATEDKKLKNVEITLCPVIEKKFDNVEPFITENPCDVLMSKRINKVPLVIGYTSDEGLFFVPLQLKCIESFDKNVELNVPTDIARQVKTRKLSKVKLEEFGVRIKTFYINADKRDKVVEVVDRNGDIIFKYPIHRFVHHYSKAHSLVYMYRFGCDTELNCFKKAFELSDYKGACHADDLFYMFYNEQTKYIQEEHDELRELIFRVTKLWTNFAKFGNPTLDDSFEIEWNPYTVNQKEFLDINNTMSMGNYADRERMEFWDQIYHEAELLSMK